MRRGERACWAEIARLAAQVALSGTYAEEYAAKLEFEWALIQVREAQHVPQKHGGRS